MSYPVFQIPLPVGLMYVCHDRWRDFQHRLDPEDLGYLSHKGAFELPFARLHNELLHADVKYVYPYLPILDLHPFLDSMHTNDTGEPVSVLLPQAVIFTAAAYVDVELLKQAGYQSRKEARKAYFERVRLLYTFSVETDKLSRIQALLHMTLWI